MVPYWRFRRKAVAIATGGRFRFGYIETVSGAVLVPGVRNQGLYMWVGGSGTLIVDS
jgi:hypothetical protein